MFVLNKKKHAFRKYVPTAKSLFYFIASLVNVNNFASFKIRHWIVVTQVCVKILREVSAVFWQTGSLNRFIVRIFNKSCRWSAINLTVIFQINEPQTKISLRNPVLKQICFYNLNQQAKLNDVENDNPLAISSLTL